MPFFTQKIDHPMPVIQSRWRAWRKPRLSPEPAYLVLSDHKFNRRRSRAIEALDDILRAHDLGIHTLPPSLHHKAATALRS